MHGADLTAWVDLIYPLTNFRMAPPSFIEMRPHAFTAEEAAWCAGQYLSSMSDVLDVAEPQGFIAR
jgi:hypothetical protein